MNIAEVIEFFGHAADSEGLDEYLTKLGVEERPKFTENPYEWVARNEEGYVLMFEARHNYEEAWGKVIGNGSMVFAGVRVHSKSNNVGCAGFASPLPSPLSFDQKRHDVLAELGDPSFDDEADGDENRLCTWNKVRLGKADAFLSVNFLPNDGGISFLTIKPVKLRFL
ncbi:hypothetical protein HFK83_24905 [Ralstonia pseudosolanacearum]|uniref:hypothetical protein n=1 Tax=Ralstonia solanacearum species complex TaxID=3116862 RepID=UPI000E56B259|nr:hypothetical protein [Ralstonia pseudosolanacearum]AXW36139.1 hypothetical protein CJO88_22970 [Ralstonia solanacearum]AXW64676.1 hypothetical protein CJO94_24250 [Ralstonia solanacearum]MCK4125589.1 hypothetical protein [Ralstonia pseudosolanacearum]